MYSGTGSTITTLYSLIGDGTGSGLTAAPVGTPDANGNLIGTHANPINPLLGPLTNNGGPTSTMAVLAGSPAIDAGSNAFAIDPNTYVPLADDQRGNLFNRISGKAVDIGAYELPTASTPPVITNYTTPGNVPTSSVIQIGTESLLFVNQHGTIAIGYWTSATQAVVPDWAPGQAVGVTGDPAVWVAVWKKWITKSRSFCSGNSSVLDTIW